MMDLRAIVMMKIMMTTAWKVATILRLQLSIRKSLNLIQTVYAQTSLSTKIIVNLNLWRIFNRIEIFTN